MLLRDILSLPLVIMASSDSTTVQSIQIGACELQLLPDKALFWPATESLILGDLHLGKATHFGKAGISIPTRKVEADNFSRLEDLLRRYRPKRVFFLGDLFHSSHNSVWADFTTRLRAWPDIQFLLIEGNHDILEGKHYTAAGLQVHDDWAEAGLLLTHEPLADIPAKQYNISGHIHPGVRLVGKGKQTLRLPCFFFGAKQGILPAFGAFTGLAMMRASKKDRVFVIYEDSVQQMQ